MPSRRERAGKFTILDIMILVAGLAVSFWIRPEGWELGVRNGIEIVTKHQTLQLLAYWASFLLVHSEPIFVVWTLTALILGLRHRPTPFRRLASRPGFMACGAVALTSMVASPFQAFVYSDRLSGVPLSYRVHNYFTQALTFQKAECGIAVAAAWMVLILGRRWRPRPEPIERIGLTLGIFWIAMIPVTLIRQLL